MINYADIAVVIIFAICLMGSGRQGAAFFAARLVSKIISLSAAIFLYGRVAHYLRMTPLFDFLKARITDFLKLKESVDGTSLMSGIDKTAEGTKSMLNYFFDHILANDNNEIYKLFNVSTFGEYVSSYIANILINIISVLIVYIAVGVIISFIFKFTKVLVKLPVVKQLNYVAGVIGGLIQGTLVTWILVIILMFFALQGEFVEIYNMVLTSKIAICFVKYNLFARVIFNVTP